MSITASSLERLEACPASATLARIDYTGPAAERGTENHRVIEEVILAGGVPTALADLWDGATSVHTEVAYVYDLSGSVRRLGKLETPRAYGKLRTTEIACTVDVEIVKPTQVVVLDWKSRKRVTPSARNAQIAIQATAVEEHYALPVVAGLVYLDNMERDLSVFNIFDRPERIARLTRIVERLGSGTPRMGSWCDYCPALAACPAHKATLATMLEQPIDQEIGEMPIARVGEVWEKLRAVEAMAERVRHAVQMRAKREPIPLANGRHLRLIEANRTSDDAKAMAARLRELGEDPDKFKKTTTYNQVREGK